jgi:ubiquinone/menaquinone biosynthesis C-methylase UbiE
LVVSNVLQTLRQIASPEGLEGYFAIKYAEFARDTEPMQDEYRLLASRVASEIQASEIQGERILEVGPGPGYIALEIAKLLPDADVVGLDISQTMVELAEENALEYGLTGQVIFRRGDASDMPFGDASFDFVVSSGSLHHWKGPERIFREIYRVLRPGCKALISDIRRDAPKEGIEALASQVDSMFMRWGLKHSWGESYTQEQARLLVDGIPFTEVTIEVSDISMVLWLAK